MNPQELVLELRRIESELMAHEKAIDELVRHRREMLELTAARANRRSVLDRAGRQRFLAGCGSTKRKSA